MMLCKKLFPFKYGHFGWVSIRQTFGELCFTGGKTGLKPTPNSQGPRGRPLEKRLKRTIIP